MGVNGVGSGGGTKQSITTVQSKKKSKLGLHWYIFLLPTLLGVGLFLVYPIIDSFRLSFFKSNGMIETFRGLQNYQIVLRDDLFWTSVWNTLYLSFFNVGLVIPISFILACMINEMKIGKNIIKSVYFISYITPGIAASTIFLIVFHPQGIMNMLFAWTGIGDLAWLTKPFTAQWAVIIYGIWKGLGFNMIIFLANLQSISRSLYEAASIDGATPYQKWRYITLPQMRGSIAFLIIMGWIGGMQRFSDVFIFGGSAGSPERSLFTMVSYIYDRGFGSFEFGVASAAAYVMFAIIMVFTVINRKVTKFGEDINS